MASVVITLRIMPNSPQTDLHSIEAKAKERIMAFTGKDEFRVETQPVAFGLNSLIITFVTPEEKGSTEEVEKQIAQIEGVSSAEVTDARRSIG